MFDRYPCLRRVLVNTKTDRVFRGVLWRKKRGFLVLRDATLLQPGDKAITVDGEVLIERDNVDFMQIL